MRLFAGNLRRALLNAASTACLGVALASCAPELVNPQVPPPGRPEFQDGYLDGCTSGFSDAGRDGYGPEYKLDDVRYRGVPDYKTGWDQGYRACYDEQRRRPKMFPPF